MSLLCSRYCCWIVDTRSFPLVEHNTSNTNTSTLTLANIFSTVVLVLLFASCTFLNRMVYKHVNHHVLGNETRSSNSNPYSTQEAAVIDTAKAVEWIELVDMEIGSQIDRQLQNK